MHSQDNSRSEPPIIVKAYVDQNGRCIVGVRRGADMGFARLDLINKPADFFAHVGNTGLVLASDASKNIVRKACDALDYSTAKLVRTVDRFGAPAFSGALGGVKTTSWT